MRLKKILMFVFFTLVFVLLLSFLSALTIPKYVKESREGNLIAEYYRESDKNNTHDVIFVGDCEAYSSFVPPLLWEKYSISSFVRGSPSQTIEQSYALICETLDYETPKVIVLSVYALCREDEGNEAYDRMTVDGMRFSRHKLYAALSCCEKKEDALSYVLPLLRFHSRWKELGSEDIEYLFTRPRVSHNGYFLQKGILAEKESECESDAAPYPLPEGNLEYLERIIEKCRAKEIELILVKAPISSWRYPWYEEWDVQLDSYAERNGISYYNLIDHADRIGIDLSRDSYDGGLHLNVSGAEKTTLFFGEILAREHNIAPHIDTETVDIWREKCEIYKKERYGE